MNIVPINTLAPLRFQIRDGSTTSFIRARIYDTDNNFVAIVDLSHVVNGMYIGGYNFTVLGYYSVSYAVYTDNTYTTLDPYYELDSETYIVEVPYSPTDVAQAVWNENLLDNIIPNSSSAIMQQILTLVSMGTSPSAIAKAVWDEAVAAHTAAGTYGLYVDVIREYCWGIDNEVTSQVHGLAALKGDIADSRTALTNEINQNEVKIDAIPGYISSSTNTIVSHVDINGTKIDALSAQSVSEKNEVLAQFPITDNKIDATMAAVQALSNNTTVRFIVPEQLVRPDTGTKNYQFLFRLFDDLGNPKAPDSAPTVVVKDLAAGGATIASGTMTQDGSKVGAYFYNYSVASGSDTHPLVVEASVIENGVTRYIPATTEVTEFSADLNSIQAQLNSVDLKVSDTQNQVNSPTYGLSAIRVKEDGIVGEINQNEVKIDAIKAKTDALPNNLATTTDVANIITAVNTRSTIDEIISALDILKSYLIGPDGRNNTDVYNKIDFSQVLQSNDPRLAHLDANISSRSTLTAMDVWTYVNRTLTTFVLPTSEVHKIWDQLLTNMNVTGSVGKLIKDYLDVAVSTRATQQQVQTLLGGVAQESSVQNLLAQMVTEVNQNEVKLNTVISLLNLVKPQTDKIVDGGAKDYTVVNEANQIISLINALNLLSTGIKVKTDTIPVNPAKEASVLAIPKTTLLDNDPRLAHLDANISSRSTLVAADLNPLATHADVNASTTTMINSMNTLATALGVIGSMVNKLPDTNHVDFKFATQSSELEAAKQEILDAIGGIGTGPGGTLTAADVWNYATKIVTLNTPQYSVLAKNTDGFSYDNRMSTVYRSGAQEVIVWAERNGMRYVGSNCTVTVKDADGNVKWSDTLVTPNADGIFKFTNTITANPSSNYYIVISIVADGVARVSNQSFFTAG